MSNNKQSKKYLSLVTYCLALVCLLLGLFLPLFDGRNLLFMMLPDAFCTTFGLNATELGDAFTRAYPIIFTGTTKAFDFAAFAIVMYAFVTAVGIIMLIPVIASNSEKKTANVCAYIVEIAAAVVLFMYTVIEIMLYLTAKTGGTDFNWDYGVIGIAFGGVLLMLIIQSFGYKKGSGFMKLIVFILGAAGVLATVAFTTLVGIKENSLFDGKLFISFFGQADGISALTMLLTGGLDAAPLLFGADDIKSTIAIIAVACAVLLALVNFALDMAAIGATTKKGTLVTDIIRYALEIVALILAVIMIFVINQEGIRPRPADVCSACDRSYPARDSIDKVRGIPPGSEQGDQCRDPRGLLRRYPRGKARRNRCRARIYRSPARSSACCSASAPVYTARISAACVCTARSSARGTACPRTSALHYG